MEGRARERKPSWCRSPSTDGSSSCARLGVGPVSVPQARVAHVVCTLGVCVFVTGVCVAGCVTVEMLFHSPLLLRFDCSGIIFDNPSKNNHSSTHL